MKSGNWRYRTYSPLSTEQDPAAQSRMRLTPRVYSVVQSPRTAVCGVSLSRRALGASLCTMSGSREERQPRPCAIPSECSPTPCAAWQGQRYLFALTRIAPNDSRKFNADHTVAARSGRVLPGRGTPRTRPTGKRPMFVEHPPAHPPYNGTSSDFVDRFAVNGLCGKIGRRVVDMHARSRVGECHGQSAWRDST
jgi:hypothetical protein